MAFCSQCGAESVDSTQRFCHACGQSLAPPAEAAASPAAPTPPLPPVSPGPEVPTEPAPEYQYIGDPQENPPAAARGLGVGKVLAGLALVAALAGGAFLAYTVFFDKSGAGSPEEAVTQMLQAVADQDGVETLRMLNPGETEGFDDVLDAFQQKIADAGFAQDDGAVLEAVQVKLENLKVDVDERGDNAARVYIVDGNLKITVDKSKLPEDFEEFYDQIPQEIFDEIEDIDIGEILEEELGSEKQVFLTTIKQDGRWYVSPVATAGEYILDGNGMDPLTASDFDKVSDDEAPKPRTADKPQDALGVLAEAISTDQVEQIFAALPRDEVAALRPFTDALQEVFDDSDGTDIQVSDLDTSFEELGDDRGRLTIRHGRLSGIINGDEGEAVLDGVCLRTVEDDFDGDSESCIPEEVQDAIGLTSISVILTEEDGGWQLDPRATIIDYAKRAIDNVDESKIRDLVTPLDPFGGGFDSGFDSESPFESDTF